LTQPGNRYACELRKEMQMHHHRHQRARMNSRINTAAHINTSHELPAINCAPLSVPQWPEERYEMGSVEHAWQTLDFAIAHTKVASKSNVSKIACLPFEPKL
jgi:hypothetical protein